MINYDLIEGLRIALAKGYTLEQAMMSFYNAGYPKEEIEEAARILLYHPTQVLTHPEKPVPEEMKKPVKAKALPTTKPKKAVPVAKTAGVSVYEERKKTTTKAVISVLVLVLFILLVVLGGIILFKDKIINLFAQLF
jgi:hypothetical protein